MKRHFFDSYQVLMMSLDEYNEDSEKDSLEPAFARFYTTVHYAMSKEHAIELAEKQHPNCEAINAEKI